MAEHTPGPWVHDTRGYPHPDVRAASGRKIAVTWGVNNQPKTKEAYEAQTKVARANARLISAAPDGLEVAQAIEHALSMGFTGGSVLAESSPIRIALQAFIAKATGAEFLPPGGGERNG